MATTPQDAQASLDAIQAALKAIGAPTDQTDDSIKSALKAINEPVRVIIPDKGPADFMAGGYPSVREGAERGLGAAAGVANIPLGMAGMTVGGLAAIPAAGLHTLFPDTMPSASDVLAQGEREFQIPLSGEYARGAEYTQGAAGKALDAATRAGGSIVAGGPRLTRGPQKPTTPAQDALRESVTRTGGEAITNALLAIGLGGEGLREGMARPEAPAAAPEAIPKAAPVTPEAPRGTSVEPPPPPPATDFQARMQQAAPKPKEPEPVTPEVQEANVSALEAPYRATPADAISLFPKLPKDLRGAKVNMGDLRLNFQSDLDRAAYIVGNPRTSSSRHADYLEWLSNALGTDENTALFLAKRSLAATKAAVKASRGTETEGVIPPYLKPAAPGTPVNPMPAPSDVRPATPSAPASVPDSGMAAVDKALEGTRLTRTPIPPGSSDMFTSMNSLRIGTGEGQPLPYTQYVRDVYPQPADEVISTIGEHVLQQAKGDPTRVHLSPEDAAALNQALAARGWPRHRVDFLEKLSAAVDYARQNRQVRNEGYAPMRSAIQDNKLMGDMLKHPENYAVTVRLDEFKPSRDFEKVCAP